MTQGSIATALVPQLGPPVRALMELVPQKISRINGTVPGGSGAEHGGARAADGEVPAVKNEL